MINFHIQIKVILFSAISSGVGGLLTDKMTDVELDSLLLLLWNSSEKVFCNIEVEEITPTSDLFTQQTSPHEPYPRDLP